MYRLVLATALTLAATAVRSEPTKVVVRVISQDAKFVGSSMGGVQIVLRDARSHAVLAKGRVQGGTGNTARIMEASGRSPVRVDGSEAAFAATLNIDEPTLVEFEAYGPLDYPASAVRVTQQRWLIPGADAAVGEGWTIELPGLVIQPEVSVKGLTARVSAKVQPMCGCPIAPKGLWPSDEYQVTARFRREGRQPIELNLAFDKAPGVFSGEIELPRSGRYKMVLFARNTRTGNSGVRVLNVETR